MAFLYHFDLLLLLIALHNRTQSGQLLFLRGNRLGIARCYWRLLDVSIEYFFASKLQQTL